MSALDNLVYGKVDSTVYTRESARAELAALRAIIKEQEQDIENIKSREAVVVDNYRRTVEAQARQLEEARWMIQLTVDAIKNRFDDEDGFVLETRMKQLIDWIAANAPEQTKDTVDGMTFWSKQP
jgi:hypothetical protein